jgi:hypothetical protein
MKYTYKIYVDMDGVVANHTKAVVKRLTSSKKNLDLENRFRLAKIRLYNAHAQELLTFSTFPDIRLVDEFDHAYHFYNFLSSNGHVSQALIDFKVVHEEQKKFRWETLNGKGFFKKLDVLEGAYDLLDCVQSIDPTFTFLTCPAGHMYNTKERDCRREKIAWAVKHFGKRYTFNFIADKKKHLYAIPSQEPGTRELKILIDDRYRFLKPWKEAGGIPILHTSVESTCKQLRDITNDD